MAQEDKIKQKKLLTEIMEADDKDGLYGLHKTQTAVEWLYDNLKSHFEHEGDLLEVVQMSFEQAKEMEKEQIMKAFSDGQETPIDHPTLPHYSREEYYNETFGGL